MEHPFHDRCAQLEILTHGTREHVIGWLKWNDGNGVWIDKDCEAEDQAQLSLDEAKIWMRKALAECQNENGVELALLPKSADPASCREWLRLICWQIGLGFHLDTPATDYILADGTVFPTDVAANLDASIGMAFDLLGNEEPYQVCASEFETIMTGLWPADQEQSG